MIKYLKVFKEYLCSHLCPKRSLPDSDEIVVPAQTMMTVDSISSIQDSEQEEVHENINHRIGNATEMSGDDISLPEANLSETAKTESNLSQSFVRIQTLESTEWGLILGASLRGKSHIESGTGCQDYHLYEDLGCGWQFFIVSDGAGSAKYAERGSKGNCTVACQLIKEMIRANHWMENNSLPTEFQWYIECRSIFEKMKLIYRSKASEQCDGTEETDFNATIILCLLTPNGMLATHIGDGRMGYLSQMGEWKSLMTPHKGEEANQTLFLQNAWTTPHVPALKISGVTVPEVRVIPELPKAVVLISDGCERSAWECSIYNEHSGRYEDVNLPHPEFMNPLIESIVGENEGERLQLFIDILDNGTKACVQERDDKTMLIGIERKSYEVPNIQAGQAD